MPILTAADIKSILCKNQRQWRNDRKLLIEPFSEGSLVDIGYDLRIGAYYKTYEQETKKYGLREGEEITISPGETVLVETLENVGMPKNCNLAGLLVSKVKQVNKGLSHISTKVDPNWLGSLTIAVSNVSKKNIKLSFKEPICCMVFMEIKTPQRKPPKIPHSDRWQTAISKQARFLSFLREYTPLSLIVLIPLVTWIVSRNNTFFTASVPISIAISKFAEQKLK